MKLLIKNVQIITMEEDKVIQNGFLGTEDGKILFVSDVLPKEYKADREIDGEGGILMPGFCNAHSHVAMTLLRGYSEGYRLQEWLTQKIFPIEDQLTPDDVYYGTLLGIAEMVRTGTTLVNDCYYFMDRAAQAYLESSFPANISRGLLNSEEGTSFHEDYRIKEAIELYEKFNGAGNDLLRVELFPHAVYTCSRDYLNYIAKVAQEKNIPISSHLSENPQEISDCIKRHGKTPPQVYAEAGLLDAPANLAHGVALTKEDYPLLKGHFVTHNPTSNLKLGSGIADIVTYEKNGIQIALGTDGASSNNNLNMMEEAHIAALLMSAVHEDPSVAQPAKILKMATENGALAMRRNTKGKLISGYDADFIIVAVKEPYHIPNHNPIHNMLYTAQGPDVALTVAGGKILYEKGEYPTLDMERIKTEIGKIKNRLF